MAQTEDVEGMQRLYRVNPGLFQTLLLNQMVQNTKAMKKMLAFLVTQETWTESFKLTIPANTAVGKEVFQEAEWPFDGRIVQVILFFPTGASATASVFFTNEGLQIFPPKEGQTIALDAITIPYKVNIPVHRGDKVRLNGNNSDTASHTIRAQLTGVEEV